MCGITGFVSKEFQRIHLRRMTDSLRHRGSDAQGFFHDSEIGLGLGHRRLSILDLSKNANQPFYSQNERFITVYNGEVIIIKN